MVFGGGQEASHVTTTDRRAGKFEAKFFHKVSSILDSGVHTHTQTREWYHSFVHDVVWIKFYCDVRFFKKKLVVLRDILDRSMLWHSIPTDGGIVLSAAWFCSFISCIRMWRASHSVWVLGSVMYLQFEMLFFYSFTSGGEDGYVRLHHFDPDYFNIKM